MIREFRTVEKRAISPDFFIMWAYELRTIRQFPREEIQGKLKVKQEPLSVFEVTYKEVRSKIHSCLIAAQRGGLKCCNVCVDEELTEEIIKHLNFIGYTVVAGTPVDGNVKILINW